MSEDNAVALLPCPFCGGEAETKGYNSCDCCGKPWNGSVGCKQCGAEFNHFDSDEEAVERWNTRALARQSSGVGEEEIREWRKLRRMLTTEIKGSGAAWRVKMEAQVAVVDALLERLTRQ
jgi:uncharacterized Zn finger protein (UPF0148 family)